MADEHVQFKERLAAYGSFRDQVRQGGLAQALAEAEAERVSRRRRRIVAACAGAAIVLLVGFCSAARLTVLPEHQARAVVLDYFEALADPAAAARTMERLVAPEVMADAPRVEGSDGTTYPAVRRQLVANAALPNNRCLGPGASTHSRGPLSKPTGCYTPPTDVTVTDVTVGNHAAVVSVEYGFEADDQRYTASLELRRDTGAMNTILAKWRIMNAFGTLDLSSVGTECQFPQEHGPVFCVTLDGLPVPDMAGPGARATVLPGRHQVEVHAWTPPVWGQSSSRTGWQSTVYTAVVAPGAQVGPEPVT